MVVPARPEPQLVVVQAQFPLALGKAGLDGPAHPADPHEGLQRRVRRGVTQVVFELRHVRWTVHFAAQHHPDLLGRQAVAHRHRAHCREVGDEGPFAAFQNTVALPGGGRGFSIHPVVGILALNVVIFAGQLPVVVDAAAANGAVRELLQLGIIAGALLFWSPIVRPGATRARRRTRARPVASPSGLPPARSEGLRSDRPAAGACRPSFAWRRVTATPRPGRREPAAGPRPPSPCRRRRAVEAVC